MGKVPILRSPWLEFKSCLCCFPAPWPWESNATNGVLVLLYIKFCCCCSVMSKLCLSRVWLIFDLMDCSSPGSSVQGIFWARILQWVAISSSRGSSSPRDWSHGSCCVSCIADRFFIAEPLGKPTGNNKYYLYLTRLLKRIELKMRIKNETTIEVKHLLRVWHIRGFNKYLFLVLPSESSPVCSP